MIREAGEEETAGEAEASGQAIAMELNDQQVTLKAKHSPHRTGSRTSDVW
jgi:hypothetical protein